MFLEGVGYMIYGIGNDIIEIDRISTAMVRTKNFISKIFTEKEIEYFKVKNMKAETIAGNFASKEAVSKALGTGIKGFSLLEIEILRDNNGKPVVNLSENILKKFKLEDAIVHVTISHNKTSAIAFAVIER